MVFREVVCVGVLECGRTFAFACQASERYVLSASRDCTVVVQNSTPEVSFLRWYLVLGSCTFLQQYLLVLGGQGLGLMGPPRGMAT